VPDPRGPARLARPARPPLPARGSPPLPRPPAHLPGHARARVGRPILRGAGTVRMPAAPVEAPLPRGDDSRADP